MNKDNNKTPVIIGSRYINYDPEIEELPDSIMQSLEKNYRDYAFSFKTKDIVLQRCKKDKINLIYVEHYNGDSIDYIEFIPVVFKKAPYKFKNNLQINLLEIKTNPLAWKYTDLSKRTIGYVKKNRDK